MSPPGFGGSSVVRTSIGEDCAALLDEESVVVPLVRVGRIVLNRCGSIGYVLFGVDRAYWANIGLVARRARRAFIEVDVQDAVAEDRDRVVDRGVFVLDDGAASLLLDSTRLVAELCSLTRRTRIHRRPVFDRNACFGGDGDSSHRMLLDAYWDVSQGPQPTKRPASCRTTNSPLISRVLTLRMIVGA